MVRVYSWGMLTKNRFFTFGKEIQPKLITVLLSAGFFCPYYPSDRKPSDQTESYQKFLKMLLKQYTSVVNTLGRI
jgi:hypothetical protein